MNGILDIPYNSRTYIYDEQYLESDGTTCEATRRFYNPGCTSFTQGAFFLSGRVLEYDVDLSRTQCGCNAAIYLVAMATSDEMSTCGDHYCDANSVCGTNCAEIDLMEANAVAWKTVIHHKYDRPGTSYGWGRYMINERSFRLLDGNGKSYKKCLYGPSSECAIDTTRVFHASFIFSETSFNPKELFSFQTILSQDGRSIFATPIRYTDPSPSDQEGVQFSVPQSNTLIAQSFDEGLTLVASYWGGPNVDSMSWLDSPCTDAGCQDVYTDQSWPWMCSGSGLTNCDQSYCVANIRVSSATGFDYNGAATTMQGMTSFFT